MGFNFDVNAIQVSWEKNKALAEECKLLQDLIIEKWSKIYGDNYEAEHFFTKTVKKVTNRLYLLILTFISGKTDIK